jgi:hypothetical protein
VQVLLLNSIFYLALSFKFCSVLRVFCFRLECVNHRPFQITDEIIITFTYKKLTGLHITVKLNCLCLW